MLLSSYLHNSSLSVALSCSSTALCKGCFLAMPSLVLFFFWVLHSYVNSVASHLLCPHLAVSSFHVISFLVIVFLYLFSAAAFIPALASLHPTVREFVLQEQEGQRRRREFMERYIREGSGFMFPGSSGWVGEWVQLIISNLYRLV